MTKPIKTRKKLLLFLAILYLLLGLFFTLAGCVSGNLICFLLSCVIFFPASILLFVQLFLLGKKILYTEEGICIHAPFQRIYTIFWTEIECLMRVDLRDLSNSDSGKTSLARTQKTEPSHYILISKSRKRICEIKEDDKDFEKVRILLETYAIPILDITALLTAGDDVFRYLPALPFLTKCSCLFELHAQTTLEQFRESVSLNTIKKVRKRLRILGWLFIPAGIFSSFLEGKLYFLAPVLILVTLWFVYIHFYPYIYLLQGHLLPYEKPDSELDYYILPLPVMGGFFTLFFSINYIYYLFMCSDWQLYLYACFFAVLLLLPFAVHQYKKQLKQHWMRTVSVVLSALILGIVLVLPVNRILTFTPANTEHLIVLEKESGKSGYRVVYDYYYVYAERQGKTERLQVSKSTYQNIKIGGTVEVRRWESILGFDYWAAVAGDS